MANVKVAVRVRPTSGMESTCIVCDPGRAEILVKSRQYTYDYVYDACTEQEELYHDCVEGLITGCLEGFDVAILAYGQTGSGKTHTMGFQGTMNNGIIPRAVSQVFAAVRDQSDAVFCVTASCLEVYNETVKDLLARGKKLQHYGEQPVVKVVGTERETLACLQQAETHRSVGSTRTNSQSSRSHAILTLSVTRKRSRISSGQSGVVCESLTSKIQFVDLAGAEGVRRTGAVGGRLVEGGYINRGLLTLGNVIRSLGDKARHIPYRDSKLTRLLQDSLGGKSKTLMIACISAMERDVDITTSTLQYASRAKSILNKSRKNTVEITPSLDGPTEEGNSLLLNLSPIGAMPSIIEEFGNEDAWDEQNTQTSVELQPSVLAIRELSLSEIPLPPYRPRAPQTPVHPSTPTVTLTPQTPVAAVIDLVTPPCVVDLVTPPGMIDLVTPPPETTVHVLEVPLATNMCTGRRKRTPWTQLEEDQLIKGMRPM